MAIGIKITDDIRIELGEIKEKILNDLEKSGLLYQIPFDKVNKQGIKETIIHIKELETEISLENDIITFIKSANTNYTHLDSLDELDTNIVEHIKNIETKVINTFNLVNYTAKIEKIESKTMNMTMILENNNQKARINILRDGNGNIYIHTLRLL